MDSRLIFVFFPQRNQENNGKYRRHQLRYYAGIPYPVDPEYKRQQKYRRNLKHQRSQKGKNGGHQTIVERGEKGRTENRNPCK